MTTDQIAAMAAFIARQLYAESIKGLQDEPAYEDADVELQQQFLLLAHASMGAHDAWLATAGYKIVKVETKAKRPGLIMPEKRKLVA